ncbi:hypothetical protein SKAU_G00384580 [Synaphobranchus kaupii]|uniref:Proteasome activator PA28 C-terminal domain-containing protein n=1 Tax=Synaphobranchus kaupii TaxID=118154 RepID=A0A9Q1EEB6_SYNKA|nr:hypothetical protein SKAU_G00384580 [Synaphobranchus kaupii]
MEQLLQTSFSVEDLSCLRTPLDTPIPDPAKEELKKKKNEEEKVFELLTNTCTKIEGFQTQISKYYNERDDAVAKASKQTHVGDYRQLVHELDEQQYCELRIMVLEIRNTYTVFVKRPKGDCKALIY